MKPEFSQHIFRKKRECKFNKKSLGRVSSCSMRKDRRSDGRKNGHDKANSYFSRIKIIASNLIRFTPSDYPISSSLQHFPFLNDLPVWIVEHNVGYNPYRDIQNYYVTYTSPVFYSPIIVDMTCHLTYGTIMLDINVLWRKKLLCWALRTLWRTESLCLTLFILWRTYRLHTRNSDH
jgi:hypothetical protein